MATAHKRKGPPLSRRPRNIAQVDRQPRLRRPAAFLGFLAGLGRRWPVRERDVQGSAGSAHEWSSGPCGVVIALGSPATAARDQNRVPWMLVV